MLLFSLLMNLANAEDFSTLNGNTLSQGQWSIGVFAPLRYGYSDDLEISIHPGWAILAPHIGISHALFEESNWQVTLHHQLGYPTPLLRKLAAPGIGGVITPDSTIPQIFAFESDMYASQQNDFGVITIGFGVDVAAALGESNYNTIDAPYAFQKSNLYQNTLAINVAVGWETFAFSKIGYRNFMQTWYTPTSEQSWVFEDKNALLFSISESQQAQIGANVIVGQYPYGWNVHAVPTFDWIWIF